MPHEATLIATIAVGFVFAFVFGFVASRLNLPPLVGYLVAGVVIGVTPGFTADNVMAGQLAEIGVILLMFGVGLHFSAADLLAVRWIAIPGAVCQILIATVLGTAMAMAWGWSLGGGLVLGLSLSVASTVVLLKALEERNAVETANGRIAIGWLIFEDLAMVLALVLLPAFAEVLGGHVTHGASEHGLALTLAITLAKVAAFVGIVLMFGPRVLPWLLRQVARTGSRELFTLSTLAMAVGIAFASAKLFGVSLALGAFFAGVVLNGSQLSHKAAENSLPLQDAFAVLFFVSVGMLFEPRILVDEPLMVAGVLVLILIAKPIVALGLVLVLGYPMSTALIAAASLAQIGEFSFILAGLGIEYKLMPKEGLSLILAGALLSISLNRFVFGGADLLNTLIRLRPKLKRFFEDLRSGPFGRLQGELNATRLRLEQKAAEHKIFTPQELVDRFPLFAGLTAEQREVLVLHFHPVKAQPGDRLIRKGDKADAVYFISAGSVEVSVSGRRIKLGPGDFFGEMALISGQPRSADVTALDYSEFLTLSQRDFRQFLRRYPEINARIAALAAQRGAMNQQPVEQIPDAPGQNAD
ncbi:MAG: cation:proton antiporter [Opitutaceae bacterium]